ncbi:Sodium/glucose cotransporter [Phycisphaerae bacterium RAS1]|nr:Sodium/glucose cotransporter [Phycisphaerae bacterium RAS1]
MLTRAARIVLPDLEQPHGGSPLQAHFTLIDWAVLVGYLLLSTLVGALLAGKQATIRDFFLGGKTLPWPAVSASIIATEISAVTLLSVPAIVFAPGGNLTYLQLAIGSIIARVIVAVVFVPAFYEREIFSPYDYIGRRLGPPARTLITLLFMLGSVLGQSVRVLITALVLEQISGIHMTWCIWIIGLFGGLWTLLGGITTVIWTDVIQFVLFIVAMAAALVFVLLQLPGGWSEVFSAASAAGKLQAIDLSSDPKAGFTLWTGLIGNTVLCLSAYGTDQMMAQRMFCCRGPVQARRAILASNIGLITPILALLVGLALFAFYQRFPLAGEAAAAVAAKSDRVFPVFVLQNMPPGLVGLIIAGIFAAAMPTSAISALSQTVMTTFYQPWRARRTEGPLNSSIREDRLDLFVSRILIVIWSVVLSGMAQISKLAWDRYGQIINLALEMATYTGGALLAAFLLALLRLNVDYRGIVWSAPLSVLCVFGVTWHQPWAQWTTLVLSSLLAAVRLVRARGAGSLSTVVFLIACGLPPFLSCFNWLAEDVRYISVAWPWNVPIGFIVAFSLGWLLARRQAAAGA